MSRKKRTAAEKAHAVARYVAKEASVKQLAKECGVSDPAVYQWITQAREQAAIDARAQEIGPEALEKEHQAAKDLLIWNLKKQVADLKRKLFVLWLQKESLA